MKVLKFIKKLDIVLITLGLFCMIYNPPVILIGKKSINSLNVIGAISLVYLAFRYKQLFELLKDRRLLFLIGGILTIMGYLRFAIWRAELASLTIRYPYFYFILSVIPFALALALFVKEHKWKVDDFLELIIFIATVQAVIAMAAFLFDGVQKVLIARFRAYGYGEVYEAISSWRMYGFAGGMTYASAVFQGMIAIIALEMTNKKSNLYFINAALIAFSAVINARTSIIVMGIGFLLVMLIGQMPLTRKLWLIILLIFGVLALGFAAKIVSPETYDWIMTGVNEIIGFFKGDFEDGYFAYIMDAEAYPIPQSVWGIIFGEGHDIMGGQLDYGVASDVGYINNLWAGGFCFIFLTFIMWTVIIRSLIRSQEGRMVRFIGIFCACTFWALNFKGSIFGMNDTSNFVMIFFILISQMEMNKGRVLNPSIGDRL